MSFFKKILIPYYAHQYTRSSKFYIFLNSITDTNSYLEFLYIDAFPVYAVLDMTFSFQDDVITQNASDSLTALKNEIRCHELQSRHISIKAFSGSHLNVINAYADEINCDAIVLQQSPHTWKNVFVGNLCTDIALQSKYPIIIFPHIQ